jgi:SAM-dependent methyltransferase
MGFLEENVLLHKLLGLPEEESIFLAEECLQDLLTLPVTREILDSGIEADACIELQGGLGTAFHLTEPAPLWLLLTDRYSEDKALQRAENLSCSQHDRREASGEELFPALAEYFARSLAEELFCQSCSYGGDLLHVEERIDRLKTVLEALPGLQTLPPGRSILEICCGSGMATQALLRLGHRPWSMDSDRCDLCQALKNGLLDPQRSFVLDARLLPRFFPPGSFDVVLGFMVGLIDLSNWQLWKEILLQASLLAKEQVLYTTYTERESKLIAKALRESGWKVEIIDNRNPKGIYDQWVCSAVYEGGGKD